MSERWIQVCAVGDLVPGETRSFELPAELPGASPEYSSQERSSGPAGVAVALFHVDGELLAVEDRCTHQAARLSEGPVVGAEVFCPRHAARFCLRSGRALSPPATEPLRTYEVQIEDEAVWVRPA